MDNLIILIAFALIIYILKSLYNDKQRIREKYKDLHQCPNQYPTNYHTSKQPTKTQKKKHIFDPYNFAPYKKASVLTPAEKIFYVKLIHEAYGHKLFIFPKVRLEDIAEVKNIPNREKYRNNVKSRHIDFILVNTQYDTIAGIELDDASHNTSIAQEIDEFKNGLFKAINVPLFRVKISNDYTSQLDSIFTTLKLK